MDKGLNFALEFNIYPWKQEFNSIINYLYLHTNSLTNMRPPTSAYFSALAILLTIKITYWEEEPEIFLFVNRLEVPNLLEKHWSNFDA